MKIKVVRRIADINGFSGKQTTTRETGTFGRLDNFDIWICLEFRASDLGFLLMWSLDYGLH